jgi:hypothetical protein
MAQSSRTLLSGVLEERNGRYYLTSGGLTAELVVGSAAAQNLSAFVGQSVSFRGRQTAARIEQAQLLPPIRNCESSNRYRTIPLRPGFRCDRCKGCRPERLAERRFSEAGLSKGRRSFCKRARRGGLSPPQARRGRTELGRACSDRDRKRSRGCRGRRSACLKGMNCILRHHATPRSSE